MTTVEQRYIENNGRLDAYAWPGSYPVFYVCPNSDTLCPTCAQHILEANRNESLLIALGSQLGWDVFDDDGMVIGPDAVLAAMHDHVGITRKPSETPTHYDVNWEDNSMSCAECHVRIESAYVE